MYVTHAYPYAPDRSTFLVETDEATWRAAGFDRTTAALPPDASDDVALDHLSDVFARHLDGHRLIGMIQPDAAHSQDEERPALFRVGCVGRITQFAEAGDGRYILELTGVARFRVVDELSVPTAYRQCKVDFAPFTDDFTARKGEDAVDRAALLSVLRDFLKANKLKVDWDGVENAPNEALVNALAMMSPYGPPEKQAMLEAPDLKTRAEILIAVTEMDLAKKRTSGDPPLQ